MCCPFLAAAFVLVMAPQGCGPVSRPGLPPSSPFPAADAVLPQGVATGDVTSHSAVVWFRTAARARVVVEWVTDAAPPDEVARSEVVTTSVEQDFTGSVRLEPLQPATGYRYRVLVASAAGRADFQETGAGRFMTAASPEHPEAVTFLWGGDLGGQQHCRKEQVGYGIFATMLQQRPAFTVLLGDLIYSDDRCPAPPNVPGGDFLAETLDQYRAKHRYQREDPAYQRFLSKVPVYVMWDDHEVQNNFAGPHEPRMVIGRQAFREYWPIAAAPDDPNRLYRRVRRGADLELFVLDTRQYRDRNADPDGPNKTMLGQRQLEWLLNGLVASRATWKVIATSVPLSLPKPGSDSVPGNDSWARGPDGTGFQSELRTIVRTILERSIRNVVWIAADVHFAQVNAYDPDGDGVADFHEFISGPLSAKLGQPVSLDPTFRPTVLYAGGGFSNFGLVTVRGANLQVQIIDEAGVSRYAHTFSAR